MGSPSTLLAAVVVVVRPGAMAAILPKVAQGAANSLLRRAGNYSQKKSESNSKPKVPQGRGGQANGKVHRLQCAL